MSNVLREDGSPYETTIKITSDDSNETHWVTMQGEDDDAPYFEQEFKDFGQAINTLIKQLLIQRLVRRRR